VLFFLLTTKILPIVAAGLLPLYLFAQNLGHARHHLVPAHPLVHGR
jgi:hypothetical protein